MAAAGECQRASLPHPSATETFPGEDLARFFENNAGALEKAAAAFDEQGRAESAASFRQMAASLRELAAAAQASSLPDLEDVERRLTVLEEKMFSILLNTTEEAELVATRAEMDRAWAPVRQKMGSEQISHLQKQFLTRKLLEKAGLPRLSLFYV